MAKITLSEVNKKHLRIITYLVVSGILGYILSLLVDKPELLPILTPAINYILYALENELKNEGYRAALK